MKIKGRNGYKRRGDYAKFDTGNWDSKNLAMGRDINLSHVRYGDESLSADDIDSIPGVEIVCKEDRRNKIMEIADAITEVAEELALLHYEKPLKELDEHELKEIILIAENEVLGI